MKSHTVLRSLSYAALTIIALLMLLPFIHALSTSFMPLSEVYRSQPFQWPAKIQIDNYAKAFQQLPLFRFMMNSAIISTAAALGAVLTASMTGYALSRSRGRLTSAVTALVISSIFIPGMILVIPRYLLFQQLGWLDSYKPMIVPAWLGGGAFNILLFRQSFRGVSESYDAAAALDGASLWQTYWHVLMPMLRPVTLIAFFLSFAFHWNDFFDPLLYMSDFSRYPVSVGLRMYQSLSGTWINVLMAASLISTLPLLMLFMILVRRRLPSTG